MRFNLPSCLSSACCPSPLSLSQLGQPETQVHGGQSGTGPQLPPRRRSLTEVRGRENAGLSQELEHVSFSILPALPSPTKISTANSTGIHEKVSTALRTMNRTTTTPSAPTAVTTNGPSASPTKPPKDTNVWTFKIDIGNQRQHVGSWYGAFTRDEIKAVLKERCRQGKKQWGEKTYSTEHWSFWTESSSKFHIIESIGNDVYISVTDDNIPGDYGEDLRQAFIEQNTETFMIAVDDDKNCYKWDRKLKIYLFCNDKMCAPKDSRAWVIRWCNALDFVRVAIADKDGNEKAHMKVELKFQGLVDQGKFDCKAIIDAVDKDAGDKMQQK